MAHPKKQARRYGHMTNSIKKGHAFEREIANSLREELGDILDADFRRILDQTREKELGDIEVGPFVIECKRYASMASPPDAWWDQVWTAACNSQKHPVLIYRFDRQQKQCVVPLYLLHGSYNHRKDLTATLDWRTLIFVMRQIINADNQIIFSPE